MSFSGTMRARCLVPPITPTVISGSPKVALSAATMTSHCDTITSPLPSAWPLTAAITGTGLRRIASNTWRTTRVRSSASSGSSAPSSATSPPATNARSPPPVSTMQRMLGSLSAERRASRKARWAATVMAFTGGRSIMISSTWGWPLGREHLIGPGPTDVSCVSCIATRHLFYGQTIDQSNNYK